MNRKAFLLGFFSTAGQVLLLREMISSFNGDELFIGTALFGWLISVAVGAGLGGRGKRRITPVVLFLAGLILLPVMIVAARLCPLLITEVAGEVIPFSLAAIFSIVLMIPVGIVSGWLFPVITGEGHRPSASIVKVYLFEGIGAFAGGVIIALLIGVVYSTLAMALVLGIIVLLIYFFRPRVGVLLSYLLLAVFALIAVWHFGPDLDYFLEKARYKSYQVEKSFDTPYGHQTILFKDNAFALLTDNTVEATFPDLSRSENLLIPPFLYKPYAKNVLFIGRAEFGIMQLADSLSNVKLMAVDPRKSLSAVLDRLVPDRSRIVRFDDDPLAFFSHHSVLNKYDIIILNPGEPDNYKNGRLLTEQYLMTVKTSLKNGGILYFPSFYDTDRYISQEKKELLSVISNSLNRVFERVVVWPGEMTLFFASDDSLLAGGIESVMAMTDSLSYAPQYINRVYLADRLDNLKVERLNDAVQSASLVNSIDKPILPYYQAILRSRTGGIDQILIPFLFKKAAVIVIISVMILIFFLISVTARQRRRTFALFLYFVAGIVSLSLELISFYVFQSSLGSLYSEMAVLVGAFMLGLAIGAYSSLRMEREHLEFPALLLLLMAALLFLITHNNISGLAILFYHICFLFTMALATGSLFVAATGRYYFGKPGANRGVGYAFELIGSAIGALVSTSMLLPIIGLPWLLISIIVLIVIAFIGAVITA